MKKLNNSNGTSKKRPKQISRSKWRALTPGQQRLFNQRMKEIINNQPPHGTQTIIG